MEVNTGKSHFLVFGNVRGKNDTDYKESEKEQVLLGVTVDSNYTFEKAMNNFCKRASQKLNALARVAPFINMQKRRIIMKFFVTYQFGYCPLIWMFHSSHLNSIHGRVLRITKEHLSFQEQLNKDSSVSMHHRNLQLLATELFKFVGACLQMC